MSCNSGAMFYCTNTASEINLSNVNLLLSEDETLLTVSAGRWGKDGRNGGDCTLAAKDQVLEGTIFVDNISELTVSLEESAYTGEIHSEGQVDVYLGNGSTWTLTGDSAVSMIDGDLSGIILNGYTLTVNGAPFEA